MSQIYTLKDLVKFTKEEGSIIESIFNPGKVNLKKVKPSKQAIDNILNYSKALSIRKSDNLDNIEMILN